MIGEAIMLETPKKAVSTNVQAPNVASKHNVDIKAKNSAAKNLEAPQLAKYSDYRLYLSDFYEFKRKTMRGFNYAVFAARADIKSPNYLKLVIDGKRNLSPKMALKFAKAMSLDREKSNEFVALVQYNQALTGDERNHYLRSLAEIRVKHQIQDGDISKDVWEKVPSWITWLVYEMMDQQNIVHQPEEIHKWIRRKVKLQDVKLAFEKLQQNEEIVFDQDTASWRKTSDVTKQRDEIPVELVKKLQSELISLGLESLYNDSPKDREFGALTLCLNEEEFEKIKFELRQMRKKYYRDVNVSRKAQKGERVYQFNMQLFPLTDKASPSGSAVVQEAASIAKLAASVFD